MRKVFFLVFFLMATLLPGQNPKAGSAKSPKESAVPEPDTGQPEIPEHRLKFEKTDAITGIEATHAWGVPVQCNSDGTLFLSFVKPYDPSKPLGRNQLQNLYYSVGGKEGHLFAPTSIPDLHDISVVGWFPSGSSVAFLLNATKETGLTPLNQTGPSGEVTTTMVNRGKRHSYIATFDLAGTYQQTIELPMDYQIYRFAALGSGKVVISGYDQANDAARLLLLDSSGKVEKPIQLPVSIQNIHAADGHDRLGAMLAASKSFGMIEFTSYRDGILVWRAGHNDPVIEVSGDGAVRELPMEYPKGFVLADFVPSDKRLIVHLEPANQPEGVGHDLHAFKYYEANSSDGSLMRQFIFSDPSVTTIECENSNTFISFETDDDGKLRRLLAN